MIDYRNDNNEYTFAQAGGYKRRIRKEARLREAEEAHQAEIKLRKTKPRIVRERIPAKERPSKWEDKFGPNASIATIIRKLSIAGKNVRDIEVILSDIGMSATRVTIGNVNRDVRQTLAVLREDGLINKKALATYRDEME